MLENSVVEKLLSFKVNEWGEVAVLFSGANRLKLVVFPIDGQPSMVLEEETNFPPTGTIYSFVRRKEILFAVSRESPNNLLDTLLLVDVGNQEIKELILPGDTLLGQPIESLGLLGGQIDGDRFVIQLNKLSGEFLMLAEGQIPSIPRPPRLMPEQVVNAASYVFGPIAPGIIVSLFASDLADADFSAQSVPLPVELGGTRITAADIDCPLYYVGPNQANFQVPFEVQGDFVDIEVIRGQQSR